MPRPPRHRPWHKAEFDRLRYHFLDGASLEDLMTLLTRPAEDIISTLHKAHLLMVRGGDYYRVHPTPFAPSSKSKALSPPLEELSMKWKCKDGRVLDIKDMTTDHLRNTIAMLRRNNVVTQDTYLSCLSYVCSGSTPDGAAMAAESELNSMRPWKGLELMEAELAKRSKNSA